MELWFWAAVCSAVFAGVSNFYFKQAAARGYSAELFSLYGGIISIIGIAILVFLFQVEFQWGNAYVWFAFFGGVIAGTTNIFKVLALRYIDSTIYFPLYKLLAPSIAIIFGITFFAEQFTYIEWAGMALGLTVPLFLINPSENRRQSNLLLGLVLVGVTGITSATSAALNKLSTDAGVTILLLLLFASLGVFVGASAMTIKKTGLRKLRLMIFQETSAGLLLGATLRSVLITISLSCMLLAYALDGTLAIVQTIHSMYILIPILLAIIFYGEHWNLQKVVAILLSVASLALLG